MFRALGVAVAAVCVVVRVRGVVAFGPTDFDDAYMFLRYAHHLRGGQGLVWNAGEAAVFGVTSPAYLLLLTALQALAPSFEDGRLLQIASCGLGLAAVPLLAFTCARFSRHPRLHGNFGLWLAMLFPLVALSEAFEFHVRSGMDTTLSLVANALVIQAGLAFAERPTPRAAVLAALASFAAVLARPDNLLVAELCPLLLLWRSGGKRSSARLFAGVFTALVLLALALARWRLGTALPLAFHAKQPGAYRGFVGEYTWNPYLFLEVFLKAALPFVAVLLVLVDRARWRLAAPLLLPVLLTFPFYFWVNQIMGHLGRFYFPFLPYFAVSAALVADDALIHRSLRAFRVLAAALAIVAGGPLLEAAGRRYQARARGQQLASLGGYSVPAAAPLPELDSWQSSLEIARLAATAPPGTVFAMSEHGLVGARAPTATIVDVLGLHDRVFALQGFSAAELWRRRPDALWMPHPDHTQMLRDILDSDELWADYDFFPDAFTYGVALRRDGPAVLRAHFDERWKAVYATRLADDYKARRQAPQP
ncbi:MAG TPA: hypothetical protein VN914_05180 [Polyangia bacterium]|nr:hypothetical protein [Polyangia bacterium]